MGWQSGEIEEGECNPIQSLSSAEIQTQENRQYNSGSAFFSYLQTQDSMSGTVRTRYRWKGFLLLQVSKPQGNGKSI